MPVGADISRYALIAGPIFFVLVWIGTSMLIAALSGWHRLAGRFTSGAKPCGDIRTAGPWFHTVYARYATHYNSVIRMAAAHDALYLSVLPLFRAGHPPLRIPWNDIRVVPVQRGLRQMMALSLGNKECVTFRISMRMARKLGLPERMAAALPGAPPPA
ncbi:MAG TPA: hypothetical protein VG893_04530 [Terracidiphilus sp.]|nr:hypothetical protein [Terracidiphilus sp.]